MSKTYRYNPETKEKGVKYITPELSARRKRKYQEFLDALERGRVKEQEELLNDFRED